MFPMYTVFIVLDVAAAFLLRCNCLELLVINNCCEVFGHHILVERTFAWMNTFRRLAKDFEITIPSQETMVIFSRVMLLIRRL